MEQGAIIPSRFGSGLAVMNKARAGAIEYGAKEARMTTMMLKLSTSITCHRLPIGAPLEQGLLLLL